MKRSEKRRSRKKKKKKKMICKEEHLRFPSKFFSKSLKTHILLFLIM